MLMDMATAPSFSILELLDRVVLLADGVVRHHNSIRFLENRLAVFGHSNPAHVNILQYAMEIINTSSRMFSSPPRSHTKKLSGRCLRVLVHVPRRVRDAT
jgi:hypothetical protein